MNFSNPEFTVPGTLFRTARNRALFLAKFEINNKKGGKFVYDFIILDI